MILLHIMTGSREQAIEIVDFLTEEKLILHALVNEKLIRREMADDGTFRNMDQVLVTGQTKALLFSTIDEKLREKYRQDIPILYSVPIIHMDWEQSRELIDKTLRI